MKPTSIIFLIVSVLLIIVGAITAGVANRMGAAEGIVLTESKGGDEADHTVTYEYEKDRILKISACVDSADINIIGGAAKPYVELVNFFGGTYELTTTNRVLTIKDSVDLTSPQGIASFVMNFGGLRGVVNQITSSGLEKKINIYLTDAAPVNAVELVLGEGNVTVRANKAATDYVVSMESGNLELADVVTSSKLEVTIAEGGITLDNCSVARLVCDLERGSVKATAKLESVDAEISMGDFTYKRTEDTDEVSYSLICQSGAVSLNGESRGSIFNKENSATENLISVTVGVGDIVIIE